MAGVGLAACVPARRDDAWLSRALDALQRGEHGDALLAAEYVCRRRPHDSLPALLRARIVQACRPELAAHAWYHAWRRTPTDHLLQDALLQAWLTAGARANVAGLGPAFLPQRCRDGLQGSLLPLLRQAGLRWTGACWKDGAHIAGRVYAADSQAQVRLLLADEQHSQESLVPADGSLFRLACPRPHGVWSVALATDAGQPLLLPSSPLAFYPEPGATAAAAPAAQTPRAVAIIIPVYGAIHSVQACIASVLASLPHHRCTARVVVVDDASPQPELAAWLDAQAAGGHLTLLRNRYNLGFIESCNRGMRLLPQHDVLLLNADTLVHGNWLDRMLAVLYATADIASVCPWSNNGEIASFPQIGGAAATPDAAQLAELDRAAAATRAASAAAEPELLSCCGFAMLMRRSVLDQIGLLDGAGLVRGYGEEVDWCLRARAAGYRHLLASGVFVAHAGSTSFGMEKTLRVRQNRAVLQARYPDYYPAYQRLLRDDPLQAVRRSLREALDGNPWLTAAQAQARPQAPAALPAALPSTHARIAVGADAAGLPGVLATARKLASRPYLPVRLLVFGEVSEALWRTGVVDVLPADGTSLFSDSTLAGLAGCVAVLDAGAPSPLPLPRTTLDVLECEMSTR